VDEQVLDAYKRENHAMPPRSTDTNLCMREAALSKQVFSMGRYHFWPVNQANRCRFDVTRWGCDSFNEQGCIRDPEGLSGQ